MSKDFLAREIDETLGIYKFSCINCDGVTSDYRLRYKAPCLRCLKPELLAEKISDVEKLLGNQYEILRLYRAIVEKPVGIERLYHVEKEVRKIEEFFTKATRGFRFWGAQRTWAKRVVKGKSFSIIAPTGMGKTMFILTMALYMAKHHRKSYLVFPTTPLLLQAYEKAQMLSKNAGLNVTLVAFHGRLSKKKREEVLEQIRRGDFDVLFTTSQFLHRYTETLTKNRFAFVAVDDVDAILRSGKMIRRLLNVIGFSDNVVDAALELYRSRQRLSRRLTEEERAALEEQIKRLEDVVERARRRVKTILVVSSATGKPRGIYPRLFRILMGFEAGSRSEAIRNIIDAYIEPRNTLEEEAVKLIARLGDGGLVYVTLDRGIEFAEKIASLLREQGIRAEAFHSKKNIRVLEDFEKGEIDVLVGVATYYGVMVRGLDMPARVKYAVFIGVPRHRFSTRLEQPRISDVVRILSILREVLEGDEKRLIETYIGRITSRLRRLTAAALMRLNEELLEAVKSIDAREKSLNDVENSLLRLIIEALLKARELLERPDVWKRLQENPYIAIVEEGGRKYILVPDAATYIQASGRTSRLYPGGITKGLSIIIVDDKRLLNGLERRMRWLYEGFEFKALDTLDLDKIMDDIRRERELVRRILAGEVKEYKQVELSRSALLIVESPNKARTIASFFGRPSIRVVEPNIRVYEVTTGNYILSIVASVGHVYDLAVDDAYIDFYTRSAYRIGRSKIPGTEPKYGITIVNNRVIPIYTDLKRCTNGHQFTDDYLEKDENGVPLCPKCGAPVVSRKIDIVKALRELASEVDIVLIGTDPDTEGEKIGWDIRVLISPYTREIKRIEFHEVTRRAILEALRNPRDFDERLVKAQIVRRVEDRWIGFALSEKLWYDLWPKYCAEYLVEKKGFDKSLCCTIIRNLSAGRVQTPVLEYIVRRYIESREPHKYGKLRFGIFVEADGRSLYFELSQEAIEKLGVKKPKELKKREVYISQKGIVEEELAPPPPFTTDTLLEEASRRLGFSTTRTMQLAQELFEMGFITYHRTDSTRVSTVGLAIAKQWLMERYGDRYIEVYQPRTWGEGGAHEAIRPTRPIDMERLIELIREGIIQTVRPLTRQHYLLYDLIFRRFIASQMKNAVVTKQVVAARIDSVEIELEYVVGIKQPGFLEIYSTVQVMQPIPEGIYYVVSARKINPPLAKYHDVIRWMKENGIGRPSTYAKIIQTLLDRRYVKTTTRTKALLPMPRGIYVLEFLKKYYNRFISVETTRRLEKLMKMVEAGEADYQDVLRTIHRDVIEIINTKSDEYRRLICGEQAT